MRILPAALAISAAVHGAAIAWVRTRNDLQPQASHAVTPPIEIVSIEQPPVAVALLDDHSASSRVATTSPSVGVGVAAPRGRVRISTGHASAPETPEVHTSSHSTLMDMRKPEVTHGISDEFVSSFLAHDKPVIAIDGERDAQHLHDPRWVANASPDEVRVAREGLAAGRERSTSHELERDGTGYKATHTTFVAHVDRDGSTHLEDKANLQRKGLLGATFDVTDALMRHFGDDPYASNKRKFLDATRDERYQIGTEYKHRQLAQSGQLMQANIDRLWATQSTMEARKRGLFQLWDDCAETGADDVIAGGRDARALVIGAIRSRLTGADAYTTSELATLNAHRTSRARFAPYAE